MFDHIYIYAKRSPLEPYAISLVIISIVGTVKGLVQFSGFCGLHYSKERMRLPLTRSTFRRCPEDHVLNEQILLETSSTGKLIFIGDNGHNRRGLHVMSPDISSPSMAVELLDHWNDEYEGVIINPESLPSNANAFASALRASLFHWRLKGKKGVWLKIQIEQAELVPVVVNEGFNFHHAEAGYVMLTHWIPDEPCLLPSGPSHHIGVGGFLINDNKEVLVVKEKCSGSCSGVWKLPTGYLNKSEDLFSGVVREVKEETGIDSMFLEIVAFRHCHLVAFEESDLLFICMLKPLSFDITIEAKEILAAKWMAVDELMSQQFYEEDQMSKRVIEICVAAHERLYAGFLGHQLHSKFDGRISSLYYDSSKHV